MKIYPAIDLKGGKVVRLIQGKADQEIVYFDDVAIPAQKWRETGAEWVHVVDLDGAFDGEPKNWASIEKILSAGMKVELGGGMRTEEIVDNAISHGVSRVVIGTRAANDIDFIRRLVDKHGDKIAVGIDAKGGYVAVKGWVDTVSKTALELAREVEAVGVKTIIYTDISTDGMLSGPNYEAQKTMMETVGCNIIASGGVSRIEDIEGLKSQFGERNNFDGVIVGKALYDKKVELADMLRIAEGR